MSLIPCPECGHNISSQAEACPECGHPNRPKTYEGPKCYACSAQATTRCQKCGALSCISHVQNIYIGHGVGGANELRCEACYSSAATIKVFTTIIAVIVGILFFLFVISHFNSATPHGPSFP